MIRPDFSYDRNEELWGMALAWAMVISVTLIITVLVAAFAFQAQAATDLASVEQQLGATLSGMTGETVTVEILP